MMAKMGLPIKVPIPVKIHAILNKENPNQQPSLPTDHRLQIFLSEVLQ
jgi:hypothetical protein